MKLGLMLPVNRTIQWDVAAQLGVEYAVTKAAPELVGFQGAGNRGEPVPGTWILSLCAGGRRV